MTPADGGLHLWPIRGIGEVRPGDDLAALLQVGIERGGWQLCHGDVLVVPQKVVSKAENQLVHLGTVEPSPFALQLAKQWNKDARQVEVVLRESRRIVRMDRGVIIAETRHGLVCANAGVDISNVDGGRVVALLPEDPDASAEALRRSLVRSTGASIGVVISDTFGRPWREGQVNVAIGAAGLQVLCRYQGERDPYGYELRVTEIAVADELASAAELVMGKTDGIAGVLVRGLSAAVSPTASPAASLVRDSQLDLFR